MMQLLRWQGYRCALTGRKLTPDRASLDHIIPVRNGGRHVIENAQLLHRDVNKAKTTMTNEQFIQLCRDVVKHNSSQSGESQ
ncbi:MAG: HNH endonuclease [Planctomycetia bacterium]|nr:HNH endonuclease [Planctomycetia bacterium]